MTFFTNEKQIFFSFISVSIKGYCEQNSNLFMSVTSGIGYLKVAIRVNMKDTIIWEQTSATGDKWMQGIADIGRVASPFQVHIGESHPIH